MKKLLLIAMISLISSSCTDKTARNYYQSLDFRTIKSGGSLTLIENFPTYQQTTNVTCGPSCLLMILNHHNLADGYNEMKLRDMRGTQQDTTYLRHLIKVVDEIGTLTHKSTFDYPRDSITPTLIQNFLKDGHPIIIGTNEWGGHWQIIIGYDTMNTPATDDDVLILADPYDRTDHKEDGYIAYPFENFYYGTWRNYYDPDFNWGLFLVLTPK